MAWLRSLFVLLPLSGLVVAACSGSSSVEGSPGGGSGAGGSGGTGVGGGSASGGKGGGSAAGGKAGSGTGGSGSAGKGSGGASSATGGTAGSSIGQAGEGGAPAATGGSAGAGAAAGAGDIPIAQAPVELANAVCAKAFECCSAAELMALSIVGESEDQCRLAVAAFIGLYQVDVQASIAAGRAAYDGVALAGCVAEHEDRACDMLPSFGEIGCAGAVIPLIPLGEDCGAHHECIGGYCDGATQVSSPTGTCSVRKADGEPCTDANECEGGACSTATGCGPTADAPICAG